MNLPTFHCIFLICSGLNSVWRWECSENFCQKKEITSETEASALSLAACRLFCSKDASLWPKPTGSLSVGNYLARVNINSIDVIGLTYGTPVFDLATKAIQKFKKEVAALVPKHRSVSGGQTLEVFYKELS